MKDNVYKLIELTGTSTASVEDAVDKAIKRAHKTIKNLCWFQVVETRGAINKGEGGSLAGDHQGRLHRGRPRRWGNLR
jgi:flavin-binding protein dodecin